jgi:hypothetical protein
MNVIEINVISHRCTGCVAPGPTHAYAGVEEIRDVVVGHLVVAAVTDPDTDPAREDASARLYDAVINDIAAGVGVWLGVFFLPAKAEPHSASAEIVQVRTHYPAISAGPPEPHRIRADVGHFAIFNPEVACAVRLYYRLNALRGLAVRMTFGREDILRVLEPQSPKCQVFHVTVLVRLAGKYQELLRDRRNHLSGGHVFTGPREV